MFWSYHHLAWVWMSHHYPNQDRQIASFNTSRHANLNRTYFGNRITTTESPSHYLWSESISVQIAPVLFDDAGIYALIGDSVNYVTITLITVKVTVEPSDAVTEGDSVTLTCSVSNVTEAIRLAWINSDGKSVLEKTLTGQYEEEKSLSLIIQKADRCKWHWMCVLFDQNNPRVSIPYNLEITRRSCMDTWISAFSGYLLGKLIIAIGLITSLKRKSSRNLDKATRNKEAFGLQILNTGPDL
ncbi:uncharacterized protein LOC132823266 [Hemiscyllium ocellatum]|uniref:uncharacterized protein LOC132823266 n=1 Tax=Hemiscyllium ocellatum TaxID=170820 RepID=UPI00296775A5|nr:uncharacterized protein LOC132823266 [Hemiscyllium ocellatum]